jgi:hypothetical protein
MTKFDQSILKQILKLIDSNAYAEALETWAEHRRETTESCTHCHYDDQGIEQQHDCCMCLESKLRMLSLYQHSSDTLSQSVIDAARKLKEYNRQSTQPA